MLGRASQPLRRLAFWVPLMICTWLALGPGLPEAVPKISDKIQHLFAFIYLGFALRLAHTGLAAILAAAALLVYGGAIELVQGQLPNREAQWRDFVVDGLGIAIAMGLYHRFGLATLRMLDGD